LQEKWRRLGAAGGAALRGQPGAAVPTGPGCFGVPLPFFPFCFDLADEASAGIGTGLVSACEFLRRSGDLFFFLCRRRSSLPLRLGRSRRPGGRSWLSRCGGMRWRCMRRRSVTYWLRSTLMRSARLRRSGVSCLWRALMRGARLGRGRVSCAGRALMRRASLRRRIVRRLRCALMRSARPCRRCVIRFRRALPRRACLG
jgi:hypothetical protein